MGGLRFKLSEDGPFLDDNQQLTAPPVSFFIDVSLQHRFCGFLNTFRLD